MSRTLRAVEPGEGAPKVELPKSLVEAAKLGRREFLARQRQTINEVIDAGVPAHALARLIAEVDRVDTEIRRLDASEKREGEDASVDDAPFDEEAI